MRSPSLLFLIVVFTLLLSACTAPLAVTPPAMVIDTPLVGNRWRLEQIVVHGEPVSFAAAAPVYIELTPTGVLLIRYDGLCFLGSSDVVRFTGAFFNEPTWQLFSMPAAGGYCGGQASDPKGAAICADELGSDYTLEACGDLLEKQYYAPAHINETNRYELADGRLILSGDDLEMTFVMDNSRSSLN